jgi:hypothetical protein
VILVEGTPLDIELEGGTGSPLGEKIVICEVYPGGSVDKAGMFNKFCCVINYRFIDVL